MSFMHNTSFCIWFVYNPAVLSHVNYTQLYTWHWLFFFLTSFMHNFPPLVIHAAASVSLTWCHLSCDHPCDLRHLCRSYVTITMELELLHGIFSRLGQYYIKTGTRCWHGAPSNQDLTGSLKHGQAGKHGDKTQMNTKVGSGSFLKTRCS